MITKVIISFRNSDDVVFSGKRAEIWYACGIKRNGERPYLLRIFTKNMNDRDFNEVIRSKHIVHPINGEVTVNGIYIPMSGHNINAILYT